MESSLTHPLAYFDHYLEEQIFQDWMKFRQELIQEYGSDIVSIDTNDHYVIARGVDLNTFSFGEHVKRKIISEIHHSRRIIEQRFQEVDKEKDIFLLSRFLKLKVDKIVNLPAFNEFKFLEALLKPILETVDHFGSLPLSPTYSEKLTYKLTASSEEQRREKAEKLYILLTEHPAIINASKEDFINSFTGNEAGQGIRWLIKGKNKKYNKKALIYFINELIINSHIPRHTLNDFNPIAKNVFRDPEGHYIKNFRQSKSNSKESSLPMGHETIDYIISQL